MRLALSNERWALRNNSDKPPEGQGRFPSGSQGRNVDRSVKENRLHLLVQSSVRILNINATCGEAFICFDRQSVPGMLSNNDVESPLDGFCFRFGPQHSLNTLELNRLQLEMLV
jgi:hypothetical protein